MVVEKNACCKAPIPSQATTLSSEHFSTNSEHMHYFILSYLQHNYRVVHIKCITLYNWLPLHIRIQESIQLLMGLIPLAL